MLLLILLAAVYTDYGHGKIPNWIIVFGILSGLFTSFIKGGYISLLEGLGAMILPVLLLYPVFVIGGIGAGDLKLFSVVGSFLGFRGVLISLIIAFFIGSIISIVKMIRFHNFKERIYYFFSYMADVLLKGKWKLYETELKESSENNLFQKISTDFPKYKIHFALPIFLGVITYIGGILWRVNI
mgnify:FL=1